MDSKGMISIWFFIGLLLLIYGLIILVSAFVVQPLHQTVLSEFHMGIWWGLLLLLLGGMYAWVFRPRRR